MATRSIAGQRPGAAQNVVRDNREAPLGEPRERHPVPAKLEDVNSVTENPTPGADSTVFFPARSTHLMNSMGGMPGGQLEIGGPC